VTRYLPRVCHQDSILLRGACITRSNRDKGSGGQQDRDQLAGLSDIQVYV
jgi:hypothetical protein